ncbi:hypothetical protein [Stenotrophomonas pigmentata]|uniref:hypothetical protein n=1 Tax=Stenotrophomonas pigmentata TaxID=3055080 RepID=UPI0026EAD9A0|nr:hypothetical protein [Stenotrophomonas sp. 610A2]
MKHLFLALLLFPGLAMADTTCEISLAGADIAIDRGLGSTSQIQSDYGMVQVSCSPDLAWSLEVVNAQPGGVIELVGSKGNAIPAYLTLAHSNAVLGSQANGEATGGVGNGSAQALSIRASIAPSILIPADTYQARVQLSINF